MQTRHGGRWKQRKLARPDKSGAGTDVPTHRTLESNTPIKNFTQRVLHQHTLAGVFEDHLPKLTRNDANQVTRENILVAADELRQQLKRLSKKPPNFASFDNLEREVRAAITFNRISEEELPEVYLMLKVLTYKLK